MLGKVIVSMASADAQLNAMYANHVFFAKDANEIADKVKEILSYNPNDFDKISIRNSDFMNNAVSDVSAVCYAFKRLQNRKDLYDLIVKS